MSRTFLQIWPTQNDMSADMLEFTSTKPEDVSKNTWLALVGRYADSHSRYDNDMQFKAMFFTILYEALPKLNAKLLANEKLRNLTDDEIIDDGTSINNTAQNPDSEPATTDNEELPYINHQEVGKSKMGKARAIYDWKNMVGGQAYNEFLDRFNKLFRVFITDTERTIYEQN